MRVDFLVEDLSLRVALEQIAPLILGPGALIKIRHFQGKQDLLESLPALFRGYHRLAATTCVVVVLDRDRANCLALKQQIEDMALAAELVTKSVADKHRRPRFDVLIRIAVEELEAWFFGDMEAIGIAYPRARKFLGDKRGLRNPDGISGGTWETLEQILQKAGYHGGGLDKPQAAREISSHMDPTRNRSPSFLTLCSGLRAIRT